jgi:hypothetical protein
VGREGGRILKVDGNGGSKLKVRIKDGGREGLNIVKRFREGQL